MALTQKQENFCLAYIKTGNASEAYRQSYNASKMKKETITEEASRLLTNHNISTRLRELRDTEEKATIITVEARKEYLTRIVLEGNEDRALKAIDLLNKMDAVYVEKRETELKGKLDTEFKVKFVKPDA